MTRETSTRPSTSTHQNATNITTNHSFQTFLNEWHHQQDELLAEFTAAVADGKGDSSGSGSGGDDVVAKELISRALAHFEEYFENRSRAARDNVFSHFSPLWSSSFECAFMWIAGFRPGVLLELVSDAVRDLSPRQIDVIHRLKRETRMEEKQISDELARIQENVAAPPLLQSLKSNILPSDKQSFKPTTNKPIERLQMVVEEVLANADTLRVSTAASVAEILTPAQGLRFLAAALRLQQGMRTLQIGRDNRSARGGS